MQHILIADTPDNVRSVDVSEYDRWFNEINDVRVGVAYDSVDALSSPFSATASTVVASVVAPSQKLELTAIMNGDRAMINNSWYELNSTVYNMKLRSIKKNSVVLSGAERTVELYLRKTNENNNIKIF